MKLYSNLLDHSTILEPLKCRDGEMGPQRISHINRGDNDDVAYFFKSVDAFILLSAIYSASQVPRWSQQNKQCKRGWRR